jgi:hypothetical protein
MNFWGRAMNFWGRETALPCPDGVVLSMVASDWIIRAGDRAIGKFALCGRSGDREMCSIAQIHHAIRLILPVTRN